MNSTKDGFGRGGAQVPVRSKDESEKLIKELSK